MARSYGNHGRSGPCPRFGERRPAGGPNDDQGLVNVSE